MQNWYIPIYKQTYLELFAKDSTDSLYNNLNMAIDRYTSVDGY